MLLRALLDVISFCLASRSSQLSQPRPQVSETFLFHFNFACKSAHSCLGSSYSSNSLLNAACNNQGSLRQSFTASSPSMTGLEDTWPVCSGHHSTKCSVTADTGLCLPRPRQRFSHRLPPDCEPMPHILDFYYGDNPLLVPIFVLVKVTLTYIKEIIPQISFAQYTIWLGLFSLIKGMLGD